MGASIRAGHAGVHGSRPTIIINLGWFWAWMSLLRLVRIAKAAP